MFNERRLAEDFDFIRLDETMDAYEDRCSEDKALYEAMFEEEIDYWSDFDTLFS